MTKLIFAFLFLTLSYASFAQAPPCIDMSENYKSFKNSSKITLVQKACESLEIQDPRGEFTQLILDGVRRQVHQDEGSTTFATARFIDLSTIDVDWEIFYADSLTGLKLLRRLNYFELTTTVFFTDRFFMVKSDGSLSLIFEENWVKENTP